MQCDVVIPTRNRAAQLQVALEHVRTQQLNADDTVHILVADDGSTDNTAAVARRYFTDHGLSGRVITGPHAGSAVARNRALDASEGDVVLFLADDQLLEPTALDTHVQAHRQNVDHVGTLGFVMWDPSVVPSPLMEWMTHGGWQNDFDALLGARHADPRHYFYGSHIALRRSFLGSHRFPESFSSYGWEDLAFGRYLAQYGLQLQMVPALSWHAHFYTPDDILHRQRLIGRGLHRYQQLFPEEVLIPRRPLTWRAWYAVSRAIGAQWVLQRLCVWLGSRRSMPWIFEKATSSAFWQGIFEESHVDLSDRRDIST